MAGLPRITGKGRLGRDPELRFTSSGKAVCNFSVVSQDRRQDQATQEWKDGPTVWLEFNVWGDDAERLVDTLGQGDLVMYSGELEGRPWEDREGNKRTSYEVRFADVALLKKKGAGRQGPPPPSDDPWGSPATPAGSNAWGDDSARARYNDEPPF